MGVIVIIIVFVFVIYNVFLFVFMFDFVIAFLFLGSIAYVRVSTGHCPVNHTFECANQTLFKKIFVQFQ